MPPASSLQKFRLALGVALGLAILNAAVTFEIVWPTPKIRWATALSIELAACVLILAVAHRSARALAPRVLPGIWVVRNLGFLGLSVRLCAEVGGRCGD